MSSAVGVRSIANRIALWRRLAREISRPECRVRANGPNPHFISQPVLQVPWASFDAARTSCHRCPSMPYFRWVSFGCSPIRRQLSNGCLWSAFRRRWVSLVGVIPLLQVIVMIQLLWDVNSLPWSASFSSCDGCPWSASFLVGVLLKLRWVSLVGVMGVLGRRFL